MIVKILGFSGLGSIALAAYIGGGIVPMLLVIGFGLFFVACTRWITS